MLYAGTDPESYITECTSVYENKQSLVLSTSGLVRRISGPGAQLTTRLVSEIPACDLAWPSSVPVGLTDCSQLAMLRLRCVHVY